LYCLIFSTRIRQFRLLRDDGFAGPLNQQLQTENSRQAFDQLHDMYRAAVELTADQPEV
jgi:hypothetical protein